MNVVERANIHLLLHIAIIDSVMFIANSQSTTRRNDPDCSIRKNRNFEMQQQRQKLQFPVLANEPQRDRTI